MTSGTSAASRDNLKRRPAPQTADERQAAAADPLNSVWVGASAGTGKTKVLIDRVLRLMLPRPGLPPESATRPEKILCLTFTKTAAAEMSNRIYKELGDWAVTPDLDLKEKLAKLLGVTPPEETMHAARRLFARVLDTPGSLKLMTIHSFCQSVLRRFPIEAGLSPNFEAMDEPNAIEYLRRCRDDLIADAKKDPESMLARSFNRLALELDPDTMSDLMAKIMGKRSHLVRILKNHGDAEGSAALTIAAVYRHLGLEPGVTEDSVRRLVGELHPQDERCLKEALKALLQGTAGDQESAACLQPFLEQKERRAQLHGRYREAFFTQKGEIRKKLATQGPQKIYPDILAVLQREAERLQGIAETLRAVRLAALNAALLTVASEMVGRYERYKRDTARLDFDDLIIKTCELLAEKGMVNWVLFKLDEGIDHILVDEAQDTSPYQWRVIEALSLEFFSGAGRAGDVQRTLFVVGDEKQSIFSFQGADPRKFFEMQGFFGEKAREVQDGWQILLEHSFRSTRAVLDVVDAVFAPAEVRRGVVGDIGLEIKHLAHRAGQAGLVELWPLIPTAGREAPADWRMPVEIETGDNAASRLARRIAQTIRGWLDTEEKLVSRGRPLRAGDVLILVQSRGPIVDMLMRALKEADVPVAGIDRMTLTDEIAVMDLLALAGFALLPKDDLTLAALLKSPLVGLTEEELFDLCYDRGRLSLWGAVQQKRPAIAALLFDWTNRAGKATPYEFFATALNTACFADPGGSGRRAFYARLGPDIRDALDEFLNVCLRYEQTHTPSLQKFTDWFMRGEAEIKREQEQHKQDQVRIMTVHASKGLQAPVVFLPDTAKKSHDHNKGRIRLIWPPENEKPGEKGVPLWSPREEFDAPVYAAQRDLAREGQEEEYRRLLYVALTRAEDRLYVCGFETRRKPPEDCWHRLVANSFPAASRVEFLVDGAPVVNEAGEIVQALRFECPQEVPPKAAPALPSAPAGTAGRLPDWASRPPLAEPVPSVPLSPSRPGEDEPAVRGPLAGDEDGRFRRGVTVHRILELLPQLPAAEWEKALKAYLARRALGLAPADQAQLAEEILAVLRHPGFAPIFGPGSRAEMPIVGLVGKNRDLSGQMDRVLVTEKEVLIVDYKTNRPPPATAAAVPAIYLRQMAVYAAAMRNIYPHLPVRCALLWTDGPRLMPLPEALIEKYLP